MSIVDIQLAFVDICCDVGDITPTARAATEWRRSRNAVAVAVAVLVRISVASSQHHLDEIPQT